jgi:putative ATPase
MRDPTIPGSVPACTALPPPNEHTYGAGYRYAHDEAGHVADHQHLPDELEGQRFYEPSDQGAEAEVCRRMAEWERLIAEKRRG